MGYKAYSDSYLMSLTKAQIIELLRTAEHNFFVTEEALNNSAKAGMEIAEKFDRAKQLLKDVIEDMNTNDAWDCETCEYYGVLNCNRCVEVDDCYKWRHIDEVLTLIGEEDKNNGV